MRLTKKGWNNVLIFAVLGIVFVFNFSHKLKLQPQVAQRTVVSNQQTIVEIKTPDFKLIRTGRSWSSEPSTGLSSQQLTHLVNNWQSIALKSTTASPNSSSDYYISIYIAQQEQPIMVQLEQDGDNYLLHVHDDISLQLSSEQLPLFIGR